MSSEGKGAINMKFKEPRPLKSSHQLLRLSGGYVKQIPRYTVLHLQSFAHSFVLYIVASRIHGRDPSTTAIAAGHPNQAGTRYLEVHRKNSGGPPVAIKVCAQQARAAAPLLTLICHVAHHQPQLPCLICLCMCHIAHHHTSRSSFPCYPSNAVMHMPHCAPPAVP